LSNIPPYPIPVKPSFELKLYEYQTSFKISQKLVLCLLVYQDLSTFCLAYFKLVHISTKNKKGQSVDHPFPKIYLTIYPLTNPSRGKERRRSDRGIPLHPFSFSLAEQLRNFVTIYPNLAIGLAYPNLAVPNLTQSDM
jgi:hypothetical protein